MSSHPINPSAAAGEHLELRVEEQLGRAKPWEPAEVPVLEDLSDDEEVAFLEAISR